MQRRLFLKNAMAGSVVVTAIGAGLLTPKTIFAKNADFNSKSKDLMLAIKNASKGRFKFKVPKIAENGAIVPLTVDATNINGVTGIYFLIEKNPIPLSASFSFSGGALGYVSVRVKMKQTSPVTALVIADGVSSEITQEVKVTIGGCGG